VRRLNPVSCENHPPWYEQVMRLEPSKRDEVSAKALEKIKEAKPEAFNFIQKFGCKLVGFIPNVAYTMPNDQEQNSDVTFIHDFSQTTLLYWCSDGGFAFFVNASLKYNANGLRGFIY
jgi:hypothetical protein